MAHKYTEEQAEFIRENAPGRTAAELTALINERFGLNLSLKQIRGYKKNHGIKSGVCAQFQKGHTPFNKGKKGLYTGGVETQFKKGHKPHNHLPIGAERVRTPRKNRKNIGDYIDVKVGEPNKWKAKHILIWEAHHGQPVPKGHVVIFGDNNNRNFDPNNLLLVSRKQLAVLNRKGLIQNDAKLTKTAIIMADIYSKIHERKIGRRTVRVNENSGSIPTNL